MKVRIRALIFILLFILLTGCKKEDSQGETKDTNETSETNETLPISEETDDGEVPIITDESDIISDETDSETEESTVVSGSSGEVYGNARDYLPLLENVKYHYEGKGNEFASFDITVDYLTSDTIQYRTNNGGSQIVEVFKKNADNITRNLFRGEVYYRENLTSKEDKEKDIIIKDPVQVGNSWTLADGSKREITGVARPIETSLGTYDTVEITTTTKKAKVQEYYAKDIGLVKRVYLENDLTVTSSLSKIEVDIPLVQTVRFFYPDKNMENIIYHDKEIEFKTNDMTKIILEREYKDIGKDNASPVLPVSAKILSLYLNKDGAVYIDFSKELISQMNAGAGSEGLILQSIVNTFGNYYGVEKVYLTVENKPYESGHIVLEKGEKLKVDMEKVID